jgi:hypothetical protein
VPDRLASSRCGLRTRQGSVATKRKSKLITVAITPSKKPPRNGGFFFAKKLSKNFAVRLDKCQKGWNNRNNKKGIKQMAYFLPDSFLVGTARRVARMSRGKIVKTNKEYIRKPSPATEAFVEMLDKRVDKFLAKKERKALAKKHGVSFSD